MGIALALLAALGFGSGDYLGGRLSRVASAVRVVFVGQIAGLAAVCAYVAILGGDASGRDLLLGAVAGACGVTGLALLFKALALGRMGVVAPVVAVGSAFVPIAWRLVRGERPPALEVVGAALALVAIVLITRTHEGDDAATDNGRALLVAIPAFLGLGASLALYDETATDSGLWPVLTGRVSALACAAVGLVVLARATPRLGRALGSWAALGGLLDMTATALVVAAFRASTSVLVVAVGALGPAWTVLLSWRIGHERVTRGQLAGLVLAFAGLMVMVAA